MDNLSLLAAFVAGVLSYISPCVLPLIPGYLSFISGVTLEEMRGGTTSTGVSGPTPGTRRKSLLTSLAFVVGFSLVFVSLGASASAIGRFMMERLTLLGKIAGLDIVIFGLHTMGILKIGWLYAEKRVQTRTKPTGPIGAMFVKGLSPEWPGRAKPIQASRSHGQNVADGGNASAIPLRSQWPQIHIFKSNSRQRTIGRTRDRL